MSRSVVVNGGRSHLLPNASRDLVRHAAYVDNPICIAHRAVKRVASCAAEGLESIGSLRPAAAEFIPFG